MSSVCGERFYVAGNQLPFFCTNPKGCDGGHEFDYRKDQFNVHNYPR